MARLIRTHCIACDEDVDQEPTEYIIVEPVRVGDYTEFEHGSYMFTCSKCGAVNTKDTTPRIEQLLRLGGVMTVQELEQWFIVELEKEL